MSNATASVQQHKQRYIWIDWMRIVAIYCIIALHASTTGRELFLSFAVQVFFIISGFLFKRESWDSFNRKTLWNLVVPMVIIIIVNQVSRAFILLLKGYAWNQITPPPIKRNCLFNLRFS